MSQILKRGYFLALAHDRYLEQNIPLQQLIGNSDFFASLTWYPTFCFSRSILPRPGRQMLLRSFLCARQKNSKLHHFDCCEAAVVTPNCLPCPGSHCRRQHSSYEPLDSLRYLTPSPDPMLK